MTRMLENDAAVVAQVLAGDREAFGELVQRHSRSIFRVAFRMTGNEEDAEEVVQETFLRAYKRLDKFESRSAFSTWVYRIAVNCSIDLREKKQPGSSLQISEEPEPGEKEVQLASDKPSPEQWVFSAQVKEKIDTAMSLLTATERTAFVLRHMEGKSIHEIADVLGIRPNSTKNSIFRAVKKMRRALEPVMVQR
jgi:RNA polymerase sigma-70 factor, ECF subfamily